MYCPNCKQEHEGKFCPECGTKLVEKPTETGGFNINLGDANAISGGINLSDSHNVHKEDNSVHNTSNVSNVTNNTSTVTNVTNVAAQKSDMEILQEKKTLYLNECKRAYEDNVLEQAEVIALEECRIKLGLDKVTADAILDSVRIMTERNARKTSLNPIARTKLKILTDNLRKNEVKALMDQIDGLEALVKKYEHDELSRKYFLVLAALKPEKCIELKENSKIDSYWKSFWSYIAYIKTGRISEAENIIVTLDRFADYPEDNMTVLAIAGALMMGNIAEAKEYLNAVTGDYTPSLQCFVDSIYLLLDPDMAKEMGANENTCAFYLVNFFGQKDSKTKAEEEARLKAEAEAKVKAEEEARLKAEEKRKRQEEERKREFAEAEKKRQELENEIVRLKQEAKRKQAAEECRHQKADEKKRRIEEERKRKEDEKKRKAEEDRIRKEEEARKCVTYTVSIIAVNDNETSLNGLRKLLGWKKLKKTVKTFNNREEAFALMEDLLKFGVLSELSAKNGLKESVDCAANNENIKKKFEIESQHVSIGGQQDLEMVKDGTMDFYISKSFITNDVLKFGSRMYVSDPKTGMSPVTDTYKDCEYYISQLNKVTSKNFMIPSKRQLELILQKGLIAEAFRNYSLGCWLSDASDKKYESCGYNYIYKGKYQGFSTMDNSHVASWIGVLLVLPCTK